MDEVKHRFHEALKSTVEYVTSHRTLSAFLEKGLLTPDEFVVAGDNLIHTCPTWSWERGDPSRAKPYLPVEKQFLITRNVPCPSRAAAIEAEYEARGGEHQLDEDGYEGWLSTHGHPANSKAAPAVVSMEQTDSDGDMGGKDDSIIPDMDEFEEPDNGMVDPATLDGDYLVAMEPDESNILRTRTYDLTITYDKFYQTPRVWLFGYDEYRQYLAPEQIFEDVSQDHAKKTVTIDNHPNLPGKFASIHPCRHGHVMRKIMKELQQRGVEPRVDQWVQPIALCLFFWFDRLSCFCFVGLGWLCRYLFIFLKFIASIVPTIEYDYTMEFELGKGHS